MLFRSDGFRHVVAIVGNGPAGHLGRLAEIPTGGHVAVMVNVADLAAGGIGLERGEFSTICYACGRMQQTGSGVIVIINLVAIRIDSAGNLAGKIIGEIEEWRLDLICDESIFYNH